MPLSSPLLRALTSALAAIMLVAMPVLGAGATAETVGTPAQPAGAAAQPAGDPALPAGGPTQPVGDPALPARGPALPAEPDAQSPVRMDLLSLTPASLDVGGVLEAKVEVTNGSSRPLSAPQLELRTRGARVTDRGALAQWEATAEPDVSGAPVTTSGRAPAIAPGAKATLTVKATAQQLGYSAEPYYWGTRRISLTLADGTAPVAGLRTFAVWRPAAATDAITQSVLLDVAAPDPAQAVEDPAKFASSAQSGALARLREAALAPSVDWRLDPSLLNATRLPEDRTTPPAPKGADGEKESSPVRRMRPDPAAAGLARALDEGLGERTVLAAPYAGADVESLHASGEERLAAAAAASGQRVWTEHEIAPRGLALRIPGEQADESRLRTAQASGADVLIVPSSSLREDPQGTVTPSSVATLDSDSGSIPVLAPDPELSAQFTELSTAQDPELVRQRLLAETATIASEHVAAPRHLLIAPAPTAAPNAAGITGTLSAMHEAPWLREGRTGDLLDAAAQGDWTTRPSQTGRGLYAIGEVQADAVRPSAVDDSGRFDHLSAPTSPRFLDHSTLAGLSAAWGELEVLHAVMADDAALDAPRLRILSTASTRWRRDPAGAAKAMKALRRAAEELRERITVVPASGYNLISDSAGVPITITNGLDTAVTVTPHLEVDRHLVQIGDQKPVTVPPRGQVAVTVPVEAIANGTVTLRAALRAPDGQDLSAPVEVPLTVNPAWENWTTMVMVVAMGVLVVFGVLRARRVGSDARAPAVRVPEDPVELARSGRSRPAPDTPDPRKETP